MKDIAYTKYGLNPNSTPIAPQIIPNGITESICGEISNIPLVNNCFLESIFSFTKNKLYAQVG